MTIWNFLHKYGKIELKFQIVNYRSDNDYTYVYAGTLDDGSTVTVSVHNPDEGDVYALIEHGSPCHLLDIPFSEIEWWADGVKMEHYHYDPENCEIYPTRPPSEEPQKLTKPAFIAKYGEYKLTKLLEVDYGNTIVYECLRDIEMGYILIVKIKNATPRQIEVLIHNGCNLRVVDVPFTSAEYRVAKNSTLVEYYEAE